MDTIKPYDVASAANICYNAKSSPQALLDAVKLVPELKNGFDFGNLGNFSGRTGAFFKVKSGFGFVAKRSGNTYKNEYLVAIRGTAGFADILTDGNIGLQVSGTGKVVHAGFNRVFNDIVEHLSARIPPSSEVHFCGHSLGGALATLAADWAATKHACKVKLYTFGSPRVGFRSFSERLTASIGTENIFRVHRSTDIVPMVPIWPFVHVPQPGNTCHLPNEGYYDPLSAHSVENYAESLKGKRWDSLVLPEPVLDVQASSIDLLSLGGLKTLGTSALALIGRVIAFILKAAGVVTQGAFIAGFTVLDLISLLLEKAINVSKEIASWVRILIEKVAQLVGIAVTGTANITMNLIRYVFQAMLRSVRSAVRFAMLGS